MNDFVIRRIVARGPGKTNSTIDLTSGVNIILGPSNTGKSMIVDCIDYMFGADKVPFSPSETGYNSVEMTLAKSTGEGLVVSREIVMKDGEARPAPDVTIVSMLEGVNSGDYQTKLKKNVRQITYGDILFRLLGIHDRPEIISTQAGKSISLTPRVFFHQLCLKEGDIFKEESIIENTSKGNTITADINALAFLLYEGGIATEKFVDPKIKTAKKNAIVAYINDKTFSYDARQEALENELADAEDVEIERTIERILEETEKVERQIGTARTESQEMLSKIYSTSQELEESRFLQERYHKLHTQYDSDMQRLLFIIEGEENKAVDASDRCPFCDSIITDEDDRESYIQASKAEMVKVQQHITDLSELEHETRLAVKQLENDLALLQQKKSSVQALITMSFQPKIDELRSELIKYRRISNMRQEFSLLESLTDELREDLLGELIQNQDGIKFDAKQTFDKRHFNRLSSKVNEAVSLCKYPEFRIAGISQKSFDIEVNGKEKKSEGKGYRAFLNSIFAFVIMKYLEKHGMHAPKMLVLDSPILSLKESDSIQIPDRMRTALFSYFIEKCEECQLIIAENELPDGVDFEGVNKIEFTQKRGIGRYGFLEDFTGTVSET